MDNYRSSPAALLLIAGPSGVGKDSLLSLLRRDRPELGKPITSTTRPKRKEEIDRVHYYFLTRAAFEAGVEQGEFLEHALVHGNLYGLSRSALDAVRSKGQLPVAILDVQGVRSVSALLPVVSVFIRAPIEQIEKRIRKYRPPAEVEARLASIRRELAEAPFFDFVIDNPDGKIRDAYEDLLNKYDRIIKPRLESYAPRLLLQNERGAGAPKRARTIEASHA